MVVLRVTAPLPLPASSLPSGEQLLALEAGVRRAGSGLGAAELVGCWQLQLVWPKGRQRPALVAAALLRGLGARLEITDHADGLRLHNAVRLGALELGFRGPGWLQGRRPLLWFQFEQLELRLAGRCLWRQPLAAPASLQRQPFFALIARDPAGWLAARGRGGGLALWTLASADAGVGPSSGRG